MRADNMLRAGAYEPRELRRHLQEAKEFFRSNWDHPRCLCPDGVKHECDKTIVRAHTLPRSGALREIAENDRVLTFVPPFDRWIKDRHADFYGATEVRTKNASTLPIFCATHDKSLFACIEDQPIVPTDQQAWAMHYRAVCREWFAKLRHPHALDYARQKHFARNEGERMTLDAYYTAMKASAELGSQDLAYLKKSLDDMLCACDLGKIRYLHLDFDGRAEAATSGCAMPEHDYAGARLQDLRNAGKVAEAVSLTWIPHQGGVRATFAWVDGTSAVGRRLADSLQALPPEMKADAVLRFAFAYFENTYCRPSWWQGLAPHVQKDVLRLVQSGVEDAENRDPYVLHRKSLCVLNHRLTGEVQH